MSVADQQHETDRSPDEVPPEVVEFANCAQLSVDEMAGQAQSAANFLKALAHEGRLMILCHLSSGEKSVTELELLLASRQAAVSQQLARLRLEGMVACRRDGKAIYYSLADDKVSRSIALFYDMFCKPASAGAGA
ncbi:MAG: winged helix-turn-helix transcriptional regulator [Paracoccaceae bacterium]|nr:winged helix-turn-helix transcriptional regulator [Paracoccaceae bacterium]MDE3122703.1 winged helix-turn-helix transcriptional regulator [Paracoccaceae bacterium]MDE3239579.1 winged helix-turn-helix transcriptional regulator [Paracoccaceae bacterium]